MTNVIGCELEMEVPCEDTNCVNNICNQYKYDGNELNFIESTNAGNKIYCYLLIF